MAHLYSIIICLMNSITFAASSESNCNGANTQKLDEVQKRELIAIEQNSSASSPFVVGINDLSSKEYVINAETNGKTLPIKAIRFPSSIQPSLGTVVYFCGGPSQCMDGRRNNVPNGYDVVTFDYIGIGKNTLGPATPELMSLESQGLAAKKIIQALKLSNYIIYGHSFGTTVATVTASLIGKDNKLKQPKSVILEGVIGPRQTDSNGYYLTAERVWELLSIEEKVLLKKATKECRTELKGDESNLDRYLTQSLWDGPKTTVQFLRKWIKLPADQRIKEVLNQSSQDFDNPNKLYDRMYRSAGCQASSNNGDNRHPSFFDGLVKNIYAVGGYCDCRSINRDYDPKDFPIKAPLIYINGEYDPATPIKNAKLHFKSQTSSAEKIFITVKDGGHIGTWRELASCTDLFFHAGFSGSTQALNNRKDFSKGCNDQQLPLSQQIIQNQ